MPADATFVYAISTVAAGSATGQRAEESTGSAGPTAPTGECAHAGTADATPAAGTEESTRTARATSAAWPGKPGAAHAADSSVAEYPAARTTGATRAAVAGGLAGATSASGAQQPRVPAGAAAGRAAVRGGRAGAAVTQQPPTVPARGVNIRDPRHTIADQWTSGQGIER